MSVQSRLSLRLVAPSTMKCRRGAAVVEFAVVSPVLILFLFGIIECGRMVMVQQSLATAVREGARIAIVEGTSASKAEETVESFLAAVGVHGTQVSVSPNNTSGVAHGEPITVAVAVPFKEVSWLPNPFLFRDKTLTSSATMRRETPN
jgi:Flp pilus assembly protein TadG